MTPPGALLRKSGLTPAPEILDSRQSRFTVRLANANSGKLMELHQNLSSSEPICKVVRKEAEHGRTTEAIIWPPPGDVLVVSTIILDDTTAGRRAAQC